MPHYTFGGFGVDAFVTLASGSTIWLESGTELRPLGDFTGPGYRTISDMKAVTLNEKVVTPLDGTNVRLSSSVIGSFAHGIEVETIGMSGATAQLAAGTPVMITGLNAVSDGGIVGVIQAGRGSTWVAPAPVVPEPIVCPEGSILISDRCVPNIIVPGNATPDVLVVDADGVPVVDEDGNPVVAADVPWYKKTSTYLYAGGGLLAITLIVLALRKKG